MDLKRSETKELRHRWLTITIKQVEDKELCIGEERDTILGIGAKIVPTGQPLITRRNTASLPLESLTMNVKLKPKIELVNDRM